MPAVIGHWGSCLVRHLPWRLRPFDLPEDLSSASAPGSGHTAPPDVPGGEPPSGSAATGPPWSPSAPAKAGRSQGGPASTGQREGPSQGVGVARVGAGGPGSGDTDGGPHPRCCNGCWRRDPGRSGTAATASRWSARHQCIQGPRSGGRRGTAGSPQQAVEEGQLGQPKGKRRRPGPGRVPLGDELQPEATARGVHRLLRGWPPWPRVDAAGDGTAACTVWGCPRSSNRPVADQLRCGLKEPTLGRCNSLRCVRLGACCSAARPLPWRLGQGPGYIQKTGTHGPADTRW